jgi:TRAP-type C4-dicarboxylate transport system permease small subunit
MPPFLVRIVDGSAHALVWLACGVVLLMMAHVTADVTLRFFFNRPITGTLEIVSAYYMVVVIFLPLAYLTRNNSHIAVELFTRWLPERQAKGLECVTGALTLAYMGIWTWMAAGEALHRTREGEVWNIVFADMAVWPSRWILVVGVGLMTVAAAVGVAEGFRRARRTDTGAPPRPSSP